MGHCGVKASVIVFPGSNCDRDVAVSLAAASGTAPQMVWHAQTELPKSDLIVLPGGFSFGDYLRAGAMGARSPIMRAVIAAARAGTPVLGICNGFQLLTETGLLPGALMRNAGLKFVCKPVVMTVQTANSDFTSGYARGDKITVPVAHHDGNYTIDPDGLARLRAEDRIAFTYDNNPNGALADIAGILSDNRRVLGMMPHPERALEPAHGSADGAAIFAAVAGALALA